MSKISVGDYVYIDYKHENGTVIGDRGGHVGRWSIKMDRGDVMHASSRDLTAIRYGHRNGLSADQKIDMLLEHLGLEILDQPKIIKISELTPEVEK